MKSSEALFKRLRSSPPWRWASSRSLTRDTFVTTILSAAGKSVGFLIPIFISAWFGVTEETDTFFFAYGFVIFLTGVFASSIESVMVPFLADIMAKDTGDVGHFTGNVLTISFISLSVISVSFLIIARPLFSLITRFSPNQMDLLFRIFIEISPLLALITATSVLNGALNAYRVFSVPALSPALRALVTIAFIFLFKSKLGIHAIAFGYIAGEIFRFLAMLAVMRPMKLFSLSFSTALNPETLGFLKAAAYQSVCLAAVGSNFLVDKVMASWLREGSVTILHYADRLYMIPVALLTAGFFPVALSYWSHHYYHQKDRQALLDRVSRAAWIAGLAAAAVSAVSILLGHPIVQLSFARGAFSGEYVPLLEGTWACYVLGLMPYLVGNIFIQAYLALKKTKLIMQLGVASFFINIFLNYILMRIMGVAGIALATTITTAIITAALFMSFKKMRGEDER